MMLRNLRMKNQLYTVLFTCLDCVQFSMRALLGSLQSLSLSLPLICKVQLG